MNYNENESCGSKHLAPQKYPIRRRSASLTLRWDRKRRRWKAGGVYFWNDEKNKWSCRDKGGKYYAGFHSLRSLLRSYVGGILCESTCPGTVSDVQARYWFSRNPKRVTCRVSACCANMPRFSCVEEDEE